MALPASGAISLSQVSVELGAGATSARSLNDSTTRNLFGVASGAISMSNGYGKSSEFAFAVASNTSNANLRTLAVNAGWNGSSALTCTLNSGIYFTSTAVGTAGLTINGSFPGGVTFVNNGIVVGDGGNGGAGGQANAKGGLGAGGGGGTGGLALLIQSAVSIRNNGTIAGGGGGGGGGGSARTNPDNTQFLQGGGGGGGRSSLTNSSGGGGAAYGGAGTINGQGGGGGGGSGSGGKSPAYAGSGGAGGGWGSNGSGGGTGSGSNHNNPQYASGGGGGGAGAATSGQSNVTWLATGTRYGSLG